MSMLSTLELIRRVPLFALLGADQAEAVAQAVVKHRYRRSEPIVRQGEAGHALHILLTGRARVVATDFRGREVILGALAPGDYVGEISLIDHQPSPATVRAEVQTDALALDRADFARCLPESRALAFAIMRGLAQQLRLAQRKIESLALEDVQGRVARVLVEAARVDPQGQRCIRERLSRQDMARMVGASREMVSRVMRDLERQGDIATREDGAILVRDTLLGVG